MKKSELKEMIKAAFIAEMDMTNAQDDDAVLAGMYDPTVDEAEDMYEEEDLDEMLARLSEEEASLNEQDEEEEEEVDVDVDAEEETTDGGEEETANDSIVVDKKIVSLSSLPQETRKILDTLETLRAQAEEFGDQKFITQVGNTITFFTRDFVVAGDEPTRAKVDESVAFPLWNRING
jgi:TATA-binding protein-associated factor Taf7